LAEEIRTRWVNYIKTGSPDDGESPPTALACPRYDPTDPKVLILGETLSAEPLPEAEELDFVGNLIFGPSPLAQ
jgi:hypothetical protein